VRFGGAIQTTAVGFTALFFCVSVHASELCHAKLRIHTNGSVLFDNVLYTDQSLLKARFVRYKKHNPNCFMNLTADRNIRFETVGHVVLLLQQTGLGGRIGFLTEPRNDP